MPDHPAPSMQLVSFLALIHTPQTLQTCMTHRPRFALSLSSCFTMTHLWMPLSRLAQLTMLNLLQVWLNPD